MMHLQTRLDWGEVNAENLDKVFRVLAAVSSDRIEASYEIVPRPRDARRQSQLPRCQCHSQRRAPYQHWSHCCRLVLCPACR